MPRTRPPFPTTSGLWEKPTVINNVETMASAALIFQQSDHSFAEHGTDSSKGTKTFSLGVMLKIQDSLKYHWEPLSGKLYSILVGM